MDMVFVINKKTEARDWCEISFETVGVWPNFDKALEHLKDIKEKVGESGTVGIRVNDSHADLTIGAVNPRCYLARDMYCINLKLY